MDTVMALHVNGRIYQVAAPADAFLVDVLRDRLGLTGTKYGCGMGECGACTVLLGGEAVYSCLTLAIETQGKEITTIEGLDHDHEGALDPLQRAFADLGGVQCGFCTPGMILTAKALLAGNPSPTEEEIRRGLSGNLCRCTGYVKIVEAVQAVARNEAGGAPCALNSN
jgi:carbon-monoxide dehydrogenase small subunit